MCTRECDQGRGEVVAPQYCCSISATKLPAAVCVLHSCALVYLTPRNPLTSFAPLVVRETAGVVTSFTYGCTTGRAPQLVQLHMQRSARHARGGGRVRSVLGTESLSYYTVTLRAPIILCNTVTPRAPILHRARESPCDRPQTRGQGVLLRPSTF